MSMTREEAIEILQWYVDDAGISSKDFNEALDMALTTLRPVSREQVEKVWRGCDLCLDDSWQRNLMIPKRFDHTSMLSAELAQFCPGCGRPLTDKAVDMVMEKYVTDILGGFRIPDLKKAKEAKP